MSDDWEAIAAELTVNLAEALEVIQRQQVTVREATEAVQQSRATVAELSATRDREQTVDELVNSMVRQGYLVVDWNGNCYARSVEPVNGEHALGLVRGIVRAARRTDNNDNTNQPRPKEANDDNHDDEPTC